MRLFPLLLLVACGSGADEVLLKLDSHNPVVRQDAVAEAAAEVDEQVTAILIGMLDDPDAKIRLAVVKALDKHASPSAVEPLIARLGDTSPAVRGAAVDTLGRLGDARATPALTKLIAEQATLPPLNAIWALGHTGGDGAVEALAALRSHPNRWVVYNADAALRTLE